MDLDDYLTSDATTLARLVADKEVTAPELLAISDGLLLRLAGQLEEAQPWFQRYAELDPALG